MFYNNQTIVVKINTFSIPQKKQKLNGDISKKKLAKCLLVERPLNHDFRSFKEISLCKEIDCRGGAVKKSDFMQKPKTIQNFICVDKVSLILILLPAMSPVFY